MNRFFLLLVSFVLHAHLHAQIFEFSPKEAAKMQGRKLLVVLQEEDPGHVKQIRKNTLRLEKYRYYIATNNALLKKLVPLLWQATSEIEFKTYSECKALSNSSKGYITLEFSSLRVNDNMELYELPIDSSSKRFAGQRSLYLLREYGFFEVSLIEKFGVYSSYTFYTPGSMPNELDFTTALVHTSAMFKGQLENPKTNTADYESMVRSNNKLLLTEPLLVDSSIVEKISKNFNYIKSEYNAKYELSSSQEIIDRALLKKDTFAYFTIVPYKDLISRGQGYEGISGGGMNEFEKKFFQMQLIVDVQRGKILYYDTMEDTKLIKKDWKRLLRFTEEHNFLSPTKKDKSEEPDKNKNNKNQVPQY